MARLFDLRSDTDEQGAVRRIAAGVEFRGGNLWSLVFAILVASVGLNVNSTAVIIGAMLISPLMGPIMGAGLGLGINDLPLVRRSIRNLALAAAVSLVTSAVYFAVSPLAEAQSELLARTRPTIYDVLIALAGGTAGIVAVTRERALGNVIPGVAIATALMPPLCTAGFGLATGQVGFLFGALYLFLINSVFICVATLGVVRLLRFERVVELDPVQAGRQRMVLAAATALTVLPSLYVGWQVVKESRFEVAARRFVTENFSFPDRSVVRTEIRHGRDSSQIDATLLGRPLPPDLIEALRARLPQYGLAATRLVIHQSEERSLAPEQLGQVVRAGILEDLYKRNEEALTARDARIALLERELVQRAATERPVGAVAREMVALYPDVRSVMLGSAVRVAGQDSIRTAVVEWQRMPGPVTRGRVEAFLSRRLEISPLTVRHLAPPLGR